MGMTRGQCLNWDFWALLLYGGSDLAIAISYFCIPVMLFGAARRYQKWLAPSVRILFLIFACFISWCGIGHLLDVLLIWHPIYTARITWNLGTAMISVAAVTMLWLEKHNLERIMARVITHLEKENHDV